MSLLAHAAPISYRFPIPIWVYVVAAGAAVALSAPAAAAAVREAARPSARSRNLYPALRRLRLGRIGIAIATILFAFVVGGGLGGRTVEAHEFFENPATVLVWVDFWVGLGLVSAFVGNVWDFVSPLSAAARALDRLLARRGLAPLAYPSRLGQWPAVVLLLGWSWAELIWDPAKEPRTVAATALVYCVATLVGAAVFGAETWLGNVELFTVFARAFARFAPPSSSRRPPTTGLRRRPRSGPCACAGSAPACGPIPRFRAAAGPSSSPRSPRSSTTAGRRRTASPRSRAGSSTAPRSSAATTTCSAPA